MHGTKGGGRAAVLAAGQHHRKSLDVPLTVWCSLLRVEAALYLPENMGVVRVGKRSTVHEEEGCVHADVHGDDKEGI